MTRFRSRLAPLLAATALALAGCSQSPGSSDASASPTATEAGASEGATPAPVPSTPQLAQMDPPTAACGAMDAVLQKAVADSKEGQQFTALTSSPDAAARQEAWDAFARVLDTTYRDQLVSAAGDDQTAKDAVTSLDTYVKASSRLQQGEVPQFTDETQAEEDIKSGRQPEVNPEYTTTVEGRTQAHVALSECLPHWPVVF